MKIKNFSKFIFFNIFSLFSFIIFSDLIFSSIKINRNILLPNIPKYRIPKQVCSSEIIYDASGIYDSDYSYLVNYKRDSECYRSRGNNISQKIVLIIGGSTTDQRFVDEGKTFQDILDSYYKGKYDFINGGVDGQSSIGHLFSIKKWHSKALFEVRDKVSDVVFYIGVNDQGLIELNKEQLKKEISLTRLLRDYFANNSFIYSQLKNIYFSRSLPKTFNIMAVHGEKFIPVDFPVNNVVSIDNKNIDGYKKLITDLLRTTKIFFPKSKIHIVQQQIPGCKFKTPKTFLDRHSVKYKGVCSSIGEVYLSINEALKETELKQFTTIYPMYISSPITDDGFYDFIHTNSKGSRQIANYLQKELDLN